MCRSTDDGGRRCPCCSGENRNARDRARYAAKKAAEKTFESHFNNPIDFSGVGGEQLSFSFEDSDSPTIFDNLSSVDTLPPVDALPTIEETAAALRKDVLNINSLVYGSAGVKWITEAEKEKWEELNGRPITESVHVVRYYRPAEEVEQDIVVLGKRIEDRAHEISGVTAEEVRESWETRTKLAEEEFEKSKIEDTAAHMALVEHEKSIEGLSGGRTPEWEKEYRQLRSVKEMRARQYDRLRDKHATTALGRDTGTREDLVLLATSYQQAVSEVRSLGGFIETAEKSSKRAQKVIQEASYAYPSEWIEESNNGPSVIAKHTESRAHYSSQKAQKVRVPSMYKRKAHTVAEAERFLEEGYSYNEKENVYEKQELIERRHRDWEYGESITQKPPRGTWVEERTISDGSVIKVWISKRFQLKTSYKVSEITIDKDSIGHAFKTPGLNTALHEMAHRIEHVRPSTGRIEEAFLRRRTTNSDGKRDPLERFGGPRSGERVRPDSFISRYMGKEYKDLPDIKNDRAYKIVSREVLSTGMEMMFSGAYGGGIGIGGYKEDAEMRAFVLGMVAAG